MFPGGFYGLWSKSHLVHPIPGLMATPMHPPPSDIDSDQVSCCFSALVFTSPPSCVFSGSGSQMLRQCPLVAYIELH